MFLINKDTDRSSLKSAAIAALGALAVLFIASIIFFKERMFADTSYIAFTIVNNNSLAIQVQRYGSFITQLVPYIAQRLHLPLRSILIAYSAGFNFLYLLIACVLFRLRQYGLVILMALYYCLLVSDSYFWPIDELNQAIAWLFLMFGVTMHFGSRLSNVVILSASFLVLAFLALFTHFIVIIPAIFLWVYFIIEKENWPFSKKNTTILSSLLVAAILCKFLVTAGSHPYEDAHLHHVTHFSLQDVIDSFTTPVVQMFCYRSFTNYWTAILVFIAGIAALVKNRNKPLTAWVLLCTIGYFIIMGLTYADEDKNVKLFHIETEWASLAIIIGAPFVFLWLPRVKPKLAVLSLIAIFIIRFAYIGYSSQAFTWRVHFHERVLAQMKKKGITKLALYHEQEMNDKYILEWTAPYESLFMSAMNGDSPQRTFIFVSKDEQKILNVIKDPRCVYLFDCTVPVFINSHYFNPDTTHPYTVMTSEQFFQ